jgi:hypothetical protein
MIDERDLLERALGHFEPESGLIDRIYGRRDRRRRVQRIAAGAVGIAVFVAAIWIVTSGGSLVGTQRPAGEGNSTDAAEDVVRGFLAAFGAFDAEAAMTYVADDADLRGLIDHPAPANEEGLSLTLALLEAQRVRFTITSCQAVPFGAATSVVCEFAFHALGSDVLGRGPFSGSTFVFTVRDGEIVEAGSSPNYDRFASRMRAPFAEWVYATYPEDFHVMYKSGRYIAPLPEGFGQVYGRTTEESIRLWEQHTREYVMAVQQGTA